MGSSSSKKVGDTLVPSASWRILINKQAIADYLIDMASLEQEIDVELLESSVRLADPREVVGVSYIHSNRAIFGASSFLPSSVAGEKRVKGEEAYALILTEPAKRAIAKLMMSYARAGDAKRAWCLLNISAYLVKNTMNSDGASSQLVDVLDRLDVDVRDAMCTMARDKLYACVDPRNSLGVALEYSDLYPLLFSASGSYPEAATQLHS